MNQKVIEKQELIAFLEEKARIIRRDILTMIYIAQSGHPGGSLSAADILTTLYFHVLKINSKDPDWAERDRFILSKGHACPVWYACLAEKGFFPVEELSTLREINGRLQGHPDMKKTPGIDFTTGSLGQGLSSGIGIALALKQKAIDSRIYVMLGDGELNEGQVWEAAMAAAKFKLDHLIAVIDYNNLQIDGACSNIMPLEPLSEKWKAFNWQVLTIDGHDLSAILDAFDTARSTVGKPTMIIAKTTKGKGVSFMENECDWHGIAPRTDQYIQAMQELGVDIHHLEDNQSGLLLRAQKAVDADKRESLSSSDKASPKPVKPIPTRDAYGEILVKLGEEIPNLVVLEADISKSTRTKRFAERFPERFYQFGVAEANMMVAAAGLAATGMIPFVSTYAIFASMRASEQIRTYVCYPNLNVKIAVSHGGITSANDGVTHQATEDLGMMRTIPGLVVIMPADYFATKALVQEAARYQGPVYLRFTRDAVPIIYDSNESFEIGKGKLLREGDHISLVAIGDMVSHTLAASDALRQEGIHADVIDMHTIKPIDEELLLSSVRKTGHVVTVEDHQINGGLGGAVSEVLSEKCPTLLHRIGLKNTFAESGQYKLLLEKYQMSTNHITAEAKKLLNFRD